MLYFTEFEYQTIIVFLQCLYFLLVLLLLTSSCSPVLLHFEGPEDSSVVFLLLCLKYSLPDLIQFHTDADDAKLLSPFSTSLLHFRFLHPPPSADSLESIQNTVARVILPCESDRAVALHKALQWLSTGLRVKATTFSIAYRFIHSLRSSALISSTLPWLCLHTGLLAVPWMSLPYSQWRAFLRLFPQSKMHFPQIIGWLTPLSLHSDLTDSGKSSLDTLFNSASCLINRDPQDLISCSMFHFWHNNLMYCAI